MNFKRVILFILIVIWMATVFFFSSEGADASGNRSYGITEKFVELFYKEISESIRKDKIELLDFYVRKFAHLTLYTVGGFLLFLFANTYDLCLKKRILFSMVAGSLYAVSDEVHQLFISGRSGQVLDVFIDSFGVLLGIVFMGILSEIFKKCSLRRNDFEK